MLRVLWEPGIKHLRNLRVVREIVGERIAIHFMLLHANGQGLDQAQHQKALEWRENASRALLHTLKRLFVPGGSRHQASAQTVTGPMEKFGGQLQTISAPN